MENSLASIHSSSLKDLVDKFNICITNAAIISIPRGCRKISKPYWNNDINKAVQERRQANQRAGLSEKHREEWIKKGEEVKKVIDKAKADRWKRYVEEELSNTTETGKLWNTIKAMDGRSPAKTKGKALTVTTVNPATNAKTVRTLYTDVAKAQAFAQEYAGVSRLPHM